MTHTTSSPPQELGLDRADPRDPRVAVPVARRRVRAVLRDRRRFTCCDRRAAGNPGLPALVAGGVRVESVDHLWADARGARGPLGGSAGLGGADAGTGSPTSHVGAV